MDAKPFVKKWGANVIAPGVVEYQLWAPQAKRVSVRQHGQDYPMVAIESGWYQLKRENVAPGTGYQFVVDGGKPLPDPASRAQHTDVHSPSLIVDASDYLWKNNHWQGHKFSESVFYELHIGTFTPKGTFLAAIERLPYLAELGITTIELMPVSQFSGNRGWGYDGVLPYAPHPAYGSPDDLRALVDAAHGWGLAVILDIVLNHFGPEGNYLPTLAPPFFNAERDTPWGKGIDYQQDAVREFIGDVPLFWLSEYRLDGLRFDAIDQIQDPTEPEILVEIAQRIRATITDRPIYLTTEDNRNITALHPYDSQGKPALFDGEWNDDLHNALHVLTTGETDGYYQDFAQKPAFYLARALAEGFSWQGEVASSEGKARGVDSRQQPPQAFVDFIQNHDQTGNRALGERLITLAGEDKTRVALAMLLLSPHIPLLFMGEEYGETRPFLFFTDFHGDLANAVRVGRAAEFSGHAGHGADSVPDPNDIKTFQRSQLNWAVLESPQGQSWYSFTRELLALRREHIIPLLAQLPVRLGEIVQVAPQAAQVRWHFPTGQLTLAFNFSDSPAAVAAPEGEPLFCWPKSTGAQQPAVSLIVCLKKGII